MAGASKIEWTDATWNPVTGCDHVSTGCDNCYAERIATRFGRPFLGAVELHPERLDAPLHWRKPRRVFVNSVSDLFHPDVPDSFIVLVFAVMGAASEHSFQVLTKRPQRMASLLNRPTFSENVEAMMGNYTHATCEPPLPNVWLGVSVENQRYADLRIPYLLSTPAAVRFLSVEPMLGPVDLTSSFRMPVVHAPGICVGRAAPPGVTELIGDLAAALEPRIDWVIVGGESGPGARPMQTEWAASVVAQCQAAGVAAFVKQLGSARGGTAHHDIETFPARLQVREYPT